MKNPKWFELSRKLQSLAQSGLTYARHPSEKERYENIMALAAEMVSLQNAQPKEEIEEHFLVEKGYSTPKIGVRALVPKGDELLFVKERFSGYWNIPGGWVDMGYSLLEAVIKEVQEEAGIDVEVKQLVGIWDMDRHNKKPFFYHGYHHCFVCREIGGVLQAGTETSDAMYFSQSEILNETLPGFLKPRIAQIFDWVNKPSHGFFLDPE